MESKKEEHAKIDAETDAAKANVEAERKEVEAKVEAAKAA